jgi:GTP-binding protein Era
LKRRSFFQRYLFSRTKAGAWMFHRNFVTDQYPQEIAEMCIREKMLEYLPDEIPYSYLMVNKTGEILN